MGRLKSFRRLPLWQVLIADVLIAGAALLVFAYFHHVRPSALDSEDVEIARPTQIASAAWNSTPTPFADITPSATPAATREAVYAPTATPSAQATATPIPTPDPVGVFSQRYPDKFTDGEVETSSEDGVYTYKSKYLNIRVTRQRVPDGSSSGT